eukprot:Hpha_TRINITY_DN27297_c0_g1::TRINITY_DN27297_c0_g1_i1::g.140795::m.140795
MGPKRAGKKTAGAGVAAASKKKKEEQPTASVNRHDEPEAPPPAKRARRGSPEERKAGADGAQPPTLRVLFVGNSFTTRNNLPEMVKTLAHPVAHVETEVLSAGGASLRQHLNSGLEARIREADEKGEPFGAVVLQEQSTLPWKNPKRFKENVQEAAATIRRTARAPAPQIILYGTWGQRDHPKQFKPLEEQYKQAAKDARAILAPVGLLWHLLVKRLHYCAKLWLYDADGSHPTVVGSAFAAVFLAKAICATIPQAEPPPLTPERLVGLGVPESTAPTLVSYSIAVVTAVPT